MLLPMLTMTVITATITAHKIDAGDETVINESSANRNG
jgi:hypothetical protein